MTSTRTTTLALATGALALALAVSGCGGSSSSAPAAPTAPATSAAPTTSAPATSAAPTTTSAAPTPDQTSESPAPSEPAPDATSAAGLPTTPGATVDKMEFYKVTTDAAIAQGTSRVELTSRGGGATTGPTTITMNTVYQKSGVRVSANFDAGGQKLEMRLLPDAIYIQSGEEIVPGKPWLKLSADGDDPFSKAFASVASLLERTTDPTYNSIGVSRITVEGPDTLDGVAVTKYAVTGEFTKADIEKLYGSMGAEFRAEIEKTLVGAKLAGFTWVDAEGLIRKFEVTTSGVKNVPESTSTAVYSGYGDPIKVDAPPAKLVVSPKDIPGAGS